MSYYKDYDQDYVGFITEMQKFNQCNTLLNKTKQNTKKNST